MAVTTSVLIAVNNQDGWDWLRDHHINARDANLHIVTRIAQLRDLHINNVTWTPRACLEHPDFKRLYTAVNWALTCTLNADMIRVLKR